VNVLDEDIPKGQRLHRARLFRDKSELTKARALIAACGYWRRKEELEDAEVAAGAW
jgi:hypothetical protein